MFHKEQWQHFAYTSLFCTIQTALQITLSELHILLDKHDQLSLQGSRECLIVPTEFSLSN